MIKELLLSEYPTKRFDFALLALSLVAVSIPWIIKINSISIVILCLTTIYYWRTNIILNTNKADRTLYILFAMYFMLHVLAILYSSTYQDGFRALEKKVTFLVLPFCVFALLKDKSNRDFILRYFLFSILLASLVCFAISLYNNIAENIQYDLSMYRVNTWLFTYKLLSMNINLHPAYMSCFAALGIVFILNRVLINGKFVFNLDSLVLLFLLALITLLASRNVMITTYAIVVLSFLYFAWRFRSMKAIVFGFMIILGLVAIIMMNDLISDRLLDSFDLSGKVSNWGNLPLRLQEWNASFVLIREHLWLGISPADVTGELVKVYNERGWFQMADEAYNSHNQYIQTLLGLGLLGFFFLISVLFISFKRAILNRDYVYFCFLILFSVFSITESTLEVQKGIVFFAFFNSLFYYSSYQDTPAPVMDPFKLKTN